jgi:hypothetical protein
MASNYLSHIVSHSICALRKKRSDHSLFLHRGMLLYHPHVHCVVELAMCVSNYTDSLLGLQFIQLQGGPGKPREM